MQFQIEIVQNKSDGGEKKSVIGIDQETTHGYIPCGGFPFWAKKAISNKNFEFRTFFKIVHIISAPDLELDPDLI